MLLQYNATNNADLYGFQNRKINHIPMISIPFFQLSTVMNKAGATVSNKSPSLILLHNRHSTRIAQSASDEAMINKWKKEKALYFTPQGSNDDWYTFTPLASLYLLKFRFECGIIVNMPCLAGIGYMLQSSANVFL